MAGVATYHAVADHSIGEVAVDLTQSNWLNSQTNGGAFAGYTGAGMVIGATGVEESTWGVVKALFR